LFVAILAHPGLALSHDRDEAPDPVIFGIALANATATLQEGLAAGEHQGRPVSARFEMPGGELQLSVYTATANGFVETILDPRTAAIISVEPITDADDLAQATVQKAVMERATLSLLGATRQALSDSAGSRAVSVVPELRNGQPIARVTLRRSKVLVTSRRS
jgi:hypothetical protein